MALISAMPRIPPALPVLLLGIAPQAAAQLTVQGVRDLDFGVVLQGVAAAVAPTDPIKSGQFYFLTPGIGTRVRIRFTLPTQLNGPGGATMPIAFRNNDAMIRGTAPSSVAVFFNPNNPNNFRLLTSADANVWLGGRVTPGATQTVGTYTATVVMTVTIF
jgi:hypothetical protein